MTVERIASRATSRAFAIALAMTLAIQWGLAESAVAEDAAPASRPGGHPSTFWRADDQAGRSAECRVVLAELREKVRRQPTTVLMAVRGDQILFSEGELAKPSLVRSVRKSLLAMLYGRPVAEGRIDLDATLETLKIDDVGGLLPVERQAKLRDLLAARSGVYHPAANPGDHMASAPARGSQVPGQYFLYNNWDFNAAGDVYEQGTGSNLYDAFAREIAVPLGLEDFDRRRHRRGGDQKRSVHLSYPFYLSARDMARIGAVMLAGGRWQRREIVPADWVRTITTPVTRSADMHPPRVAARGVAYGLLWWLPEEPETSPLAGSYLAWGLFGQWILIIPKRAMVVVHKYDTAERKDGARPKAVTLRTFLDQARTLADAPCH